MRYGWLLVVMVISACSSGGGDVPAQNADPDLESTGSPSGPVVEDPVVSENRAPVASGATVEVDEDSEVEFLLTAVDPDGDALEFEIVRAPADGTLYLEDDGTVTFGPLPDFFGSDSFEFSVTDTDGASNVGVVSIDVLAINDPPVAVDQVAAGVEDVALELPLSVLDVDTAVLTYQILQLPLNGSASISNGVLQYVPAADFNGSDVLEYQVGDGEFSSTAIVELAIEPVNDAPLASNQSVAGTEDVTLLVPLSVVDVDDSDLNFQIVQQPQFGSASFIGGALQYTPDPDYNGVDNLSYQVSDSEFSDSAVVEVSVAAVNDAPVAVVSGDDYTEFGRTAALDASASTDVENDSLTFEWEQVAGPPLVLSGAATSTVSFVASTDNASVLLRVRISDGVDSTEESVEVRVYGWMQVAAGSSFALALRNDGSLWSWGWNSRGQLGDGSTNDSSTPVLIDNSIVYADVAAGIGTGFALRADGQLYAFGAGNSGQLGNGTLLDSLNPTIVAGGPFANVEAAGDSAIALHADGSLWSWGIGEGGALGRVGVSATANPVPGRIGADSNWTHLHSSGSASALRGDGSLWTWGMNHHGQHGNGTVVPFAPGFGINEPSQSGSDTDWATSFMGDAALFAIRSDGTLWVAGRNQWGELGLGFEGADELSLIQSGGDTDWQNGCAGLHTLALKNDGTLWAWGRNQNGQRGDADPNSSGIPRQLGTDDDWAAVSCSASSSYGLRDDGSLWSWGNNFRGALGIGDTANRSQPTRVLD